jgi:hypothetical protein
MMNWSTPSPEMPNPLLTEGSLPTPTSASFAFPRKKSLGCRFGYQSFHVENSIQLITAFFSESPPNPLTQSFLKGKCTFKL